MCAHIMVANSPEKSVLQALKFQAVRSAAYSQMEHT
jgi:hypothetical protein